MSHSSNPVAYAEAYIPQDEGKPSAHNVSYQAFPVNNNDNQAFSAPSAPQSLVNEAGARDFLTSFKWPAGLQTTFVKNLSKLPIRFFICDDSGSMCSNDGHKLIDTNGHRKYDQII